MAQLGVARHPGADRPGTARTMDIAVGLAVVITEGVSPLWSAFCLGWLVTR